MNAKMPQLEVVFNEALACVDVAERAAYLDSACGGNAELRKRVEDLLAAHAGRGAFLGGTDAATTSFHEKVEIGRLVAERYKLLEVIGEGGMGTVYMAEQTTPVRRLVALKVIKPGMDSKAVLARFEAERQALALMDHPNIAKVLDAGATAGGQPFFVMELVKGTPITKFCDERKLSPRERLELFVPVCQAIQHAHQKGVIHRDIKPTNVLVALYDGHPVPKVIDFGVAKAAGQALTEKTLHTGFGAIIGTPEYMSPEQATFNQLDIDTRSDVYALGVLLYELLIGSTPVDKTRLNEAAVLEVLRIVREEEPPRPSVKLTTADTRASIAATRGSDPAKLSKLLRGELDWIVMKALEKDRNRRYDTAAGLAKDVQRYLADELVEARPPSAGYRLRKFVGRNRQAAFTLVTCLAFLVISLCVSLLFGFAEARQRHEAERQTKRAEDAAQMTQVNYEWAIALGEEAVANAEEAEREKERAERNEKTAKAAADEAKKAAFETLLALGFHRALLAENGRDKTIDQVIAEAQPTLDIIKKMNPNFAASMQIILGQWCFNHGDTDKGIAWLERGLSHYRQQGNLAQKTVVPEVMSAAATYQRFGRFDQAAKLVEEVISAVRAQEGPASGVIVTCKMVLAEVYMKAGRYTDAAPLWREVIADHRKQNFNVLTEYSLRNLGECLVKSREFAAAEPVLRECLALLAKAKTPRNNTIWMQTTPLFGASLLGQKEYAEAEKVLLGFFEVVGIPSEKNTFDASLQPHVTEAVDLLVRLYEDTNQPTKSVAWRKRRPLEPQPKK